MKRVRAVIDLRLAGYRAGGIARYATELYAELQQNENLSILPIRSATDSSDHSRELRFRTPPHHRFERYSLAIELAMSRQRPDVFHATDFIAPRIPHVATIATVHDLAFLRYPNHLEASSLRYYRQIEKSKAWTDAWITPSQWTADDLTESFDIDPSAINVIPHGIPLRLSLQSPLPRYMRERFLLAVGTVEPRKRYDLLLDALSTLAAPPRLELVGKPGWNSADIEDRITGSVGVRWRQNEDDASLRDLYRTAFAVVIPSHAEGFGFAALEAMAAGTPVISSGHGALVEVTGLAALTPVTDDADGWARAIERIMDDEPLWNELSLFGRRRAREFSWDRAAAATIEVYRQAARR